MNILSMIVGALSFFSPVSTVAQAEEPPPIPPKVIMIEVVQTVPDIMKRIADCESGNRDEHGKAIAGSARQFTEDGEVLIGRLNKPEYGVDIGKYQINSVFHGERAKELGIDLYSERGNEKYAMLLYEANGTRDWSASRTCWQ